MPLVIVLLSCAVFCAMILNLAAKPRITRGLIGACTLISAIGGLILYGIGFDAVLSDPILKIVRTVMAVSRMYAGINEFAAISSAPLYSHTWSVVIFWVLHLMAFYATASATISTLGAAALKRLKYWLQRYGSSVIIFGVNNDTVEFGQGLTAAGVKNIVYVGNKPDAACETAINAAGCLLRSDTSALSPDLRFLKSLGSEKGSPVLTLYALDADEGKNHIYARALLNALENAQVDTSYVQLVIRSTDDSVECGLSRTAQRYGFGDVKNFTDVSLVGRMLMQVMPPCEKMDFRPDGTAAGDFDAVIVGFGKTGRSVLRHLVRSAQFEGCHFRAAVFSPVAESENGYFYSSYPELMNCYDIQVIGSDARSFAFYKYLREHAATLRYVVICTGNRDKNNEICTEVSSFLNQLHCSPAVCRCTSKTIAWSKTPSEPVSYRNVFSVDAIGSDALDRMATMLNYSYVNDPDISPAAAWAACDYFSRESSRAAADFLPAYLRMTGKKEAELADGWGELSQAMLENLGKTEHLRWCAFHYTMGFAPMSFETVKKRGEIIQSQLREDGKATLRISKDLPGRQHACLCSWDELDNLAELEAPYTGVKPDYKDMDIRNVLALPAVLKAAKELKK